MAEKLTEELEALYYYANTISQIRQVIDSIRIMDDQNALGLLNNLLSDMQRLLTDCLQDGYAEAENLRQSLLSMAEIKDIILLGDMLENISVPIMERWQQSRCYVQEKLDEQYCLESTSTGFLTIKHLGIDKYLHSNNDPMDEARHMAERQYNYNASRYRVFGCGLGYHIYQLYRISDGGIPITLYEMNPKMVEYAYQYGVLSWIPPELMKIIFIEDVDRFLEERRPGIEDMVLIPAMEAIPDQEQRKAMEKYYMVHSYRYSLDHELKINFYRNKELNLPDISKLDRSNIRKDIVIIAGGPSVDNQIENLRVWQNNMTLIAVGTIWKRLLREGIKPDFVTIIDPNDSTFGQVDGIEDMTAKLIIGMQAYWKLARTYKGSIYTICHSCPIKEMGEYAEKNGYEVWICGLSVTVMALEAAVRFFPDRIYLVGTDLAYPTGISHAKGTLERHELDLKGMIPVEAVDGGTVYTDMILEGHREYLESITLATEGIEYINMSEQGAKIAGTKWYKNL